MHFWHAYQAVAMILDSHLSSHCTINLTCTPGEVYHDRDGHVNRRPAPSSFCLVRNCFAQVRRDFTRSAVFISNLHHLVLSLFHVSLTFVTPARCPTLLVACFVSLTSVRTASPGARVSCAVSLVMGRTCGRFAGFGPNSHALVSPVPRRLHAYLPSNLKGGR